MRLLPRSLFGQVVFATVVAVVVSQLVVAWLLLDERARMARHVWGDQAAQRIAGFICAFICRRPPSSLLSGRLSAVPPLISTFPA